MCIAFCNLLWRVEFSQRALPGARPTDFGGSFPPPPLFPIPNMSRNHQPQSLQEHGS